MNQSNFRLPELYWLGCHYIYSIIYSSTTIGPVGLISHRLSWSLQTQCKQTLKCLTSKHCHCCILIFKVLSCPSQKLSTVSALCTQRLSFAGSRYSRSCPSGDTGVGITSTQTRCAFCTGCWWQPRWKAFALTTNPPAAGEAGTSPAARLWFVFWLAMALYMDMYNKSLTGTSKLL